MEAEEHEMSPVSDACQQLTEGLLALSARDNMPPTSASAPSPAGPAVTFSSAHSVPVFAGPAAVPQPAVAASSIYPPQLAYNAGVMHAPPMPAAVGSPFVVQHQQPLNPVILNNSGLPTTDKLLLLYMMCDVVFSFKLNFQPQQQQLFYSHYTGQHV